jgi:hypothetical protein
VCFLNKEINIREISTESGSRENSNKNLINELLLTLEPLISSFGKAAHEIHFFIFVPNPHSNVALCDVNSCKRPCQSITNWVRILLIVERSSEMERFTNTSCLVYQLTSGYSNKDATGFDSFDHLLHVLLAKCEILNLISEVSFFFKSRCFIYIY